MLAASRVYLQMYLCIVRKQNQEEIAPITHRLYGMRRRMRLQLRKVLWYLEPPREFADCVEV